MASIVWDREVAEVYDQTYQAEFEPSVVGPIVDVLAELARGGPALEFAVGTGRVALPLSARGIAVQAWNCRRTWPSRCAPSPGRGRPGDHRRHDDRPRSRPVHAVYLVANTIMNVTTQDDQLAVFASAAAHLEPGGCFVVQVIVPQLRRVPPGETARVFTLEADHVAIETFDDLAGQIAWSHHWIEAAGGWSGTRRPTATCGRPSLISWPRSRASGSGTGGRAGTGPRSPPTAAARSRYSRSCRRGRGRAGMSEASGVRPERVWLITRCDVGIRAVAGRSGPRRGRCGRRRGAQPRPP